MSETIGLTLQLNDKVSASAGKAAASLGRVGAQAEKARESLNFGKEIERAEAKLKRLTVDPRGAKELFKVQREINEQQRKLGKMGFADAFKEKLGFGRLVSASFWGDVLAEALIEGSKKALEFFADGIKDAFRAASQRENLNLGYSLSLGKKGGAEAQEDIGRFAGKTAFDDDVIAKMMLQYRRTGASQEAARQAFALAGDIAAAQGRGTDEGAVGGIMDALTNIQLKGGIGRKQLVNGLGVKADEFYASLGKKLGVSSAEAEKAAEKGGKHSQAIINAITENIEKQQGGQVGSGTIAAGSTMTARFRKLLELPENYLKTIVASAGWQKIEARLGKVFETLNPDGARGKKIIQSLMTAFDKLASGIDRALSPQNIEAFSNGVTRFVAILADAPMYLDKLVTASEVLATIWIGSKIAGGIGSLATALASANPLLIATAAALGAWAYAIKQINDLGGVKQLADDIDYFLHKQKTAGSDTATKEQLLGARVDSGVATDAERLQYDIIQRTKAKQKASGVLVAQTIHVHPAKDDTQHTKQAVTTVTQDGAQRGAERALQGMSGG